MLHITYSAKQSIRIRKFQLSRSYLWEDGK